MASFFTDLFDAVTGQQSTPQQTIIPTNDLLNQTYSQLSSQAPNVLAYNQRLAPGLTDLQLGVQNQIFGPAAGELQQKTYQSILDNLNMGGSVPPELQDLITTNILQQGTRSGVGTSGVGRLFGARSLLSAGLDLDRQRRQEALGAVSRLPTSSYTYNPQGIMDAGAVAGDIRGVQAAQDELANLTEDIRRQNFSSLLNTGGRIAGTVIGGIYGGAAGAQIGGQIGGSMITGSRVAGQQQPQSGGGGGGFTSILSGLMGGGGGGGGGQAQMRQTAYDQGGISLGSY